jgi:FAD/FMN-containing dehydrogenase
VRITGLDGDPVEVDATALERRLDGLALRPGSPGFAESIRIWNGLAASIPALVIRPRTTGDVRETVRFAAAHGVLLSIKGGGHNIAGTSLAPSGLTLDMSLMRDVEVDPARRLARVGPGCLLGDVDRATQRHGLATVLGFVSETGVAGLTLGGGFGYLTRRFGWTVDNLEEVEIVTADGAIRRVAADEHPDLFWAVRGGGGNFGVVTLFTFRLHAVGPEVNGGLIAWDAGQAETVLPGLREAAAAAPRELTLGATLRLAPPSPLIPERWHGRPAIVAFACHTGDPAAATADLAPLRGVGRPVADALGRIRYADQQSLFDATQPKGMHNVWRSEFLPGLSDGVLRALAEHGDGMASPLSQLALMHLGGALADRAEDATAFGNRDAGWFFAAAACWPPDRPELVADREWVDRAWTDIRPHSTGGNYVNVQGADDGEARLRGAYRGGALERLARLKATYDPGNLFRVNRNVAPAPAVAAAPGA